ncbi:MAG: magnetosome biogenesis CDF transporter MamM [Magnetococcus sp. DMHC-6]
MRYSKCVVCNEAVGWIGLFVNLALSSVKIFVGFLSGSHALMVDSVYSLKDVTTSILIILALKVSKKPIDQEHPFGHGKVEFILSLVVSIVLIVVTCVLFYFAIGLFLEGRHKPPHLIALWTALLSLAINIFMYFYTRCVSHEINSPIVEILSKHHKGDSIASASVAFGIIGSHYLGMPWLDTLIALFECLDLLYFSGEVAWEAFQGLMDSSLPVLTLKKIKSQVLSVPGVKSIEEMQTRRVGQEVWINLVVGVEPDQSIREAKLIGLRVEDMITSTIPHIGDVGVHFKSTAGSVPEFAVIHQEISRISESENNRNT